MKEGNFALLLRSVGLPPSFVRGILSRGHFRLNPLIKMDLADQTSIDIFASEFNKLRFSSSNTITLSLCLTGSYGAPELGYEERNADARPHNRQDKAEGAAEDAIRLPRVRE